MNKTSSEQQNFKFVTLFKILWVNGGLSDTKPLALLSGYVDKPNFVPQKKKKSY